MSAGRVPGRPQGGVAPSDATFITQTPSSGLSAEQAMSLLATGLVKNTTGTGALSIAVAGTDYATDLAGSYYRALAISRLGLTAGDKAYGFFFDDFDRAGSATAPTGWALSNTGSAAYASQIAGGKGGQARASTGATAGSFAQSFQEAFLISAIGTQKWWTGNMFAVSTAITAQSDASRGLINTASNKSILAGVWGPSSIVNFRLQYDGIATGTFLDLGVAIDTAYHLFEIYCKGDAKLYARVDEGVELSVTPASNPADSLQLFARVGNGTDAVNRSMDTDFTACLYPR